MPSRPPWQARRRPRHSSHPACRIGCAGASEIDELLDVRTKRMARHAPLAVFVIVVFAVLIYLATSRL